jgi:hypothetical protein
MKAYIGASNARKGLDFNKAVGDLFVAANVHVRTEIEMSGLGANPVDASGDIDVFAWKDDVAFVCECKDLHFARTVTEVAEQLSRFRGSGTDELSKHIRRVRWVEAHPDSLTSIMKARPRRIYSFLVISKLVPMQFLHNLPVEVVAADQITESFLSTRH